MGFAGSKFAKVATVAISTVSLGVITASAATPAMAKPPVCGEVDCPSLVPTHLGASQATLNVTQMQLENLSATATEAITGRPLVGALIEFFTTDGRKLGSAYTGYDGSAGISASENFGPGTVQELLSGYNAVLVGDGVHATASAHGAITIGTDCASSAP
ncbi:hypothetical protein [Kitasatospora viridis]|uniref:Uncharacterized protein n=1 Tax=Kitasatospora viridis TaxID=281105 RepID=A0A561SFN3_9ACTN|nr:hypothetical protein [Kitasatospora viridis]TWF73669.1 hypothetical protein FHX73_15285 [Kitasatospora viridis]